MANQGQDSTGQQTDNAVRGNAGSFPAFPENHDSVQYYPQPGQQPEFAVEQANYSAAQQIRHDNPYATGYSRPQLPYHEQRSKGQIKPQWAWARFPGVDGAVPVAGERQIWYELCGFSLLLFLFAAFNAIFVYPIVTQDATLFTDSSGNKNFAILFYHGLWAPWPEQLIPRLSWSSLETWLVRGLLLITLTLLLNRAGRTPGGILGGYKTVNLSDGQKPNMGLSFGYYCAYLLISIFPAPFIVSVLGISLWLSPLFESKSGWARGLLHRLFGLVAIDVQKGTDTAASVLISARKPTPQQ